MRTYLAAVALCILPSLALAADPADPVRKIIDITARNWVANEGEEWKYVFDEDLLSSVFSTSFAGLYREAAKKPAYDTEDNKPGDPFGYDVITNSQDGCPLQDIDIKAGAEKDGVTDVAVTFKLWTCADDNDELKKSINEVHFDVVTENGKPVISDIRHIDGGDMDSTVAEMKSIISGE